METQYGQGLSLFSTACYCPTCSKDNPCYSICCPIKFQNRQIQVPPRQKRRTWYSVPKADVDHVFWSTTVSAEVLAQVDEREKIRQEVIFELIQTEKDFVRDIQLVNRLYIKPLLHGDYIEESRRETFVRDVFANIKTLGAINHRFLRLLNSKQRESPVVDSIGTVFTTIMPDFRAYIEYGTKHVYAKYYLETELSKNERLAAFLKEVERAPECRKLPLQSFLARPVTRLGRYPLLLEQILKKTSSANGDSKLLPEVVSYIRQVLTRLNAEAGKADNFLRLTKLNQQLLWNVGEYVDLFLLDPNRQLIREGTLLLKKTTASESAVKLFLLDTCLLITKQKKDGYLKVIRRPIPLELLSFQVGQISSWNMFPVLGLTTVQAFKAKESLPIPSLASMISSITANDSPSIGPNNTTRYNLAITPMGRFGGGLVFACSSLSERSSWIEAIAKAKDGLDQQNFSFKPILCIEAAFDGASVVSKDVNQQLERFFVAPQTAAAEVPELSKMVSSTSLNDSSAAVAFSNIDTSSISSVTAAASFSHSARSKTAASVSTTSSSISLSLPGTSNSNYLPPSVVQLAPPASQRVYCSLVVGAYLLIGADNGLFAIRVDYSSNNSNACLVRCLDLAKISQMDVFEPSGLLVLLQTNNLITLSLEALISALGGCFDQLAADLPAVPIHPALHKKVKRLVSHVSFFKIGTSRNKEFLCTVRSASLTSTIKVFEPVPGTAETGSSEGASGRRKSSSANNLSKFFRIASDSIRLYKEFYIPTESTSLHFLKTKLCVGCTKGFEVIDLDSLSTQGLLDPSDLELAFALNKDAVKPIAIFRLHHGIFLLCYDQFGFFVDRMGRRARNEILTFWCGVPTAFAFQPPYLLALEPNFIEVRNMDTGELCQIIPGTNFRCLSTKGNQMYAVANNGERQLIFRLAKAYGDTGSKRASNAFVPTESSLSLMETEAALDKPEPDFEPELKCEPEVQLKKE